MKRTGHQTPGSKKEKKRMGATHRNSMTVKDLEGIKLRIEAGDNREVIADAFKRHISSIYGIQKAIKAGNFLKLVARAQQREAEKEVSEKIAKTPNKLPKAWAALSTAQRKKQVLGLKAKGWTASQIAVKFGIKPGNISYHYYGGYHPSEKTPATFKQKQITSKTDNLQAKALELHAQGMTSQEIARKLGKGAGSIHYYLYERKQNQNGKEQTNGAASRNGTGAGEPSAQENILIGFAYAETERFIGLLGERLRLSTEVLRPRLSKLLGHSPLRS